MSLTPIQVGRQICCLRKHLGLTQNQLGERLHVSFQAVSKWERGETLPDASLLPELARALETTIDFIMRGGDADMEKKPPEAFVRRTTIAQIREGVECFERAGQLLGKDSFFYMGAVGGINLKMNIDFETYMADPYTREAMVAEAALQAMMGGAYISLADIEESFQYPHWVENVREAAQRYGME